MPPGAPRASLLTRVVPVPGGIRLMQGRVVLSELRLQPGPTHSVFDVLASLLARLAPPGNVGVLGFGAGGVMAPLRALGFDRLIHAVDTDPIGHDVFRHRCPEWSRHVEWSRVDAVEWLRGSRGRFAALLDDLSEPRDGDVHKPAVCWGTLPRLMQSRLAPGGVAVFNLVPNADGSWPGIDEVRRLFPLVMEVRYRDYLNRTVVATRMPADGPPWSPWGLGRGVQADLRRMGSRLAGRTSCHRWMGGSHGS